MELTQNNLQAPKLKQDFDLPHIKKNSIRVLFYSTILTYFGHF